MSKRLIVLLSGLLSLVQFLQAQDAVSGDDRRYVMRVIFLALSVSKVRLVFSR